MTRAGTQKKNTLMNKEQRILNKAGKNRATNIKTSRNTTYPHADPEIKDFGICPCG